MSGIYGKPGWAWIHILEGPITVMARFSSFRIIQDFLINATFLAEAERTVVVRRLHSDCHNNMVGEGFKMRYIWQSLPDWKAYLTMSMYTGTNGPLHAFRHSFPLSSTSWYRDLRRWIPR
ncbi:hypothetical protein BDM02DRAFT_1456797 [Thelephora ganbajun]|uniref:Uncharacterized protein n=1 Tax=Thelephora ganbajun TaxID=370292 RepID=A0ACB6ZLQ8_THEGA|nr:hypothetical protein BDM02DRAFT_1456797 [Thelephora ganbajun]